MPWLKTQIKASGGEEKERGARKVAAQIKKGLLKAVRRPGRPSMRLRLEITES